MTLSEILDRRGAAEDQRNLSGLNQFQQLSQIIDAQKKRKQEEQQQMLFQQFASMAKTPEEKQFALIDPKGYIKHVFQQKALAEERAREEQQLSSLKQAPTVQKLDDPESHLATITNPQERAALQRAILAEKQNVPFSETVEPERVAGLTEQEASVMAASQDKGKSLKGKLALQQFNKLLAQREAGLNREALVGQRFENQKELQQNSLQAQAQRTQASAKNAQKAPVGYRFTEDGNLEPIEGGPAFAKATERGIKEERRKAGVISRADLVIGNIDKALGQVNKFTSGFGAGVIGAIPLGDRVSGGADLQKTVDSIRANIGFSELQAMRDASPTGGALGQVAVQELDLLQSVLGSLDRAQSQKQLTENLIAIKTHYQNWKKAVSGEEGQTPIKEWSDQNYFYRQLPDGTTQRKKK